MNNSRVMEQIHSMREANYEKMRHLSVKEQIIEIQMEAEPIKNKILKKVKSAQQVAQADAAR